MGDKTPAYLISHASLVATRACAAMREIYSNVVDGWRAYPVISGSFFHFPIDELNAFDDLSDKLGAPESLPVFLSIGGQLVYHGEGGYA